MKPESAKASQRDIASMGGQASSGSFEPGSERAREAGAKGGSKWFDEIMWYFLVVQNYWLIQILVGFFHKKIHSVIDPTSREVFVHYTVDDNFNRFGEQLACLQKLGNQRANLVNKAGRAET